MPRLCEFYPGICLTTEEKARKNLNQGKKKNPSQVKKNLSLSTLYIYQNTHTLQNPYKHTYYKTHTYTHTHIYNTYDAICEELLENRMPLAARNMHVAATTVSLTLRLLMSYIYIYIYIYIYMEHIFLMFLDHTRRRTTVGRTPLDE